MDGKEEKKNMPAKRTEPELFNAQEQKTINAQPESYDAKALRKDRIQKKEGWEILKDEYPELKELKSLADYVPVLTRAVSTKLGIPRDGITVLGGKPYINRTGLLARVHHDAQANKDRRIKRMGTEPVILPIDAVPFADQEQRTKAVFSKDGTAMFRGTVEFADGSIFSDIGTCNAKFLTQQYQKMSTLIPYVMEMASTRALNRAMRLATGIGLVSYEEIDGSGPASPAVSQGEGSRIAVQHGEAEAEIVKQIEARKTEKGMNEAQFTTALKKVGIGSMEEASADQLKELMFDVEAYTQQTHVQEKSAKDLWREIELMQKQIDGLTLEKINALTKEISDRFPDSLLKQIDEMHGTLTAMIQNQKKKAEAPNA